MPTKTVDLLLNLDTEGKPPAIRDLTKWFNELESEAKQVRTELSKTLDPKRAAELDKRLKAVNSDMRLIHQEAQKRTLEKSLKASFDQAKKLEQQMNKVKQVGNQIALAGSAILAPLILAAKKYVELTIEQRKAHYESIEAAREELETLLKSKDATAEQIKQARENLYLAGQAHIEFEKQAQSQVEFSRQLNRINKAFFSIGKTATEVLLPTLTKAADLAEKIADFANAHPEFIKAAAGIGGSLVLLGGIVSTTAQIVSTIATIKSLFAGIGLASAASGAGGLGLASAISAGISAAAPILATAAAVVLAAELTRQLLNWALGTTTTWRDIATTAKQLLFITEAGWKSVPARFSEILAQLGFLGQISIQGWESFLQETWRNGQILNNKLISSLLSGFRGGFINLGRTIISGFNSIVRAIVSAFARLANIIGVRRQSIGTATPYSGQKNFGWTGRANGGYLMKDGLFRGAESGKEFVMANSTTRAAESMIGGSLTQQGLLRALSGGGRRVTYHDSRRFDASVSARDRQMIRDDTMIAIAGGL